MNTSVVWFADLDCAPDAAHGKQSKHLASLTQAKLPMLPGFVITSKAYFAFLKENKLDHKIKQLISTLALDRADSIMQGERHIKQLFKEAKLSDTLMNELAEFWQKLAGDELSLSLYELGTSEKKHSAKEAKELNELFDQIIHSWAEMFSSHALWRRNEHTKDHMQTGAEIIVQMKVSTDKKGTVTTINPHTHNKDTIIITTQKQDRYVLSKKNLVIIERTIRHKPGLHSLTHSEIFALATLAKKAEKHLYFPQEITWLIDGNTIYISEMKPISNLPQKQIEKKTKLPIAKGKGITARIGTGFAKIIHVPTDLQNIKEHDVVIISEITPKQIAFLKKARAVIIQTSHPQTESAALLRMNAIPAIFQVTPAIKTIRNGHAITIHGTKGEIYRGGLQ